VTNSVTITNIFGRFIRELKKYHHYFFYYTRSLEKSRVSNTALGYIWWFLDPLLNMGIYIILVRVVFRQREANYPVFFFSAILVWRYFSMSIAQSATSITSQIKVCRDTYIPKFIFPLAVCVSGLMPFMISLGILVVLMIIFQTPITWNLLYIPLLIIVLVLFTFTCSMLAAHINVFMNDFQNILPHLITIGMFCTPIFYSIDRIPPQYQFLAKLNPLGILTTSFRNIITNGAPPPTKRVIYLFGCTIVLFIMGIYTLYKYDQIYNRTSR